MKVLQFVTRFAAGAVEALSDAFTPTADRPFEPGLTGDEIVGVRQLLEERFPSQFLHHK